MGFRDQFGAPTPVGEGTSGSREVKGTKDFDRKVPSEMGPFGNLPVDSIWGEGMEGAPFQAGLFQRVIGVQWGAGAGFLYVDPSIILSSKTGEEWNPIKDGKGNNVKGFSVNALAYGKKKWVAVTDGGMRISKDFGKTWKSVGGPSECFQIVFAGPWFEEDTKEDEGYFYAAKFNVFSSTGEIHSSTDGESWSKIFELEGFVEGPGILGYSLTSIGHGGGNSVVATGAQWVQVPPSETAFGDYTNAAKWEGSSGSIGGPSTYGPEGNAGVEGARASVGIAAAPGFISYLTNHGISFGVSEEHLVVNGATVATGGYPSGPDLIGGGPMAAADGQAWFFAGDGTGPDTQDIQFFLMSGTGERQNISARTPIQQLTNVSNTSIAVLPSNKKRMTSFAAVGGANSSVGLWANIGHGFTRVKDVSGQGSVGAGRVAKGTKEDSGGGGD